MISDQQNKKISFTDDTSELFCRPKSKIVVLTEEFDWISTGYSGGTEGSV